MFAAKYTNFSPEIYCNYLLYYHTH